ncbi:unnamed protein product [Mytilus coruscus]|uniref:Uncharacterized protein n=1 Tax=Mytilus coruscus TaxID=42192 RepID=A0A6J8ES94_MYTCO|nr:unnamed protein product [Mytilus coruscus]
MAQVLAVLGDVRHSFSYVGKFNHDFGRITGIAATSKGNILLCDYDKKNLILVDALENYLTKLNVDIEPYDVAITSQNIGYITQPKSRSVLQIDPDRMVELFKATCNCLSTTVFCVSVIPTTGKDFSRKNPCYLGVKIKGFSYAFAVNYDKMHIYVIGQGSNNIHRLEKWSIAFKRQYGWKQDLKVLDIPLDSHHAIKEPVAVCFNQDCSKLYIVNEWGKSVLVFNVI